MKKQLLCLLLTLALLGCCGCTAAPPSDDGRLQVVCSLFPYYDFVRAIGGEHVSPTLLIPAGRETHSFEPTPLDVITLSRADVLVYNGSESELWVEEILESAGENIAFPLRMMDHVDALEEEIVEGMEGHDHSHEHAHEHDHEEDEHHHEITYDEHIWTSPVGAKELCRAICETLCAADSAHADEYRANLEAYLAQLDQLDRQFRTVVDEAQRCTLVFGDRFPLLYFCKTYELEYRAAFHGCAGDTEPSLATLKYLIDKVDTEDIPVVYTIELSSQKVANAIAETTGAKVARLHSCQNVTRQEFDAGETYLTLMQANVAALKEGLS